MFAKGQIALNKKPAVIPTLCLCGCNDVVWGGRIYKWGHNSVGRPLSENAKKVLSIQNKGRKHSEETKRKLSELRKGKPGPRKGAKLSIETRNKISRSCKGKLVGSNNPFYGKHHSSEIRELLSKAHLGKIPWNKGVSFNSGENHPNWKGGLSYEPYCPKFNETFKEKIRSRDHRTCQLCGCKEVDNGQRLDVHHVHYDKKNCAPDCVSLCRRCNAKVNFDRDYYESLFMSILERSKII